MNKNILYCLVFLFVLGSSVGLVSATDHYLNYTVDIGATVPLYSGDSEYNGTDLFAHKNDHKLHFNVYFYDSSGNPVNTSVMTLVFFCINSSCIMF